jgi:hypothetical protein
VLTAASTRSIQEIVGQWVGRGHEGFNEVRPGDWGGHGGSGMVTADLVS